MKYDLSQDHKNWSKKSVSQGLLIRVKYQKYKKSDTVPTNGGGKTTTSTEINWSQLSDNNMNCITLNEDDECDITDNNNRNITEYEICHV